MPDYYYIGYIEHNHIFGYSVETLEFSNRKEQLYTRFGDHEEARAVSQLVKLRLLEKGRSLEIVNTLEVYVEPK